MMREWIIIAYLIYCDMDDIRLVEMFYGFFEAVKSE